MKVVNIPFGLAAFLLMLLIGAGVGLGHTAQTRNRSAYVVWGIVAVVLHTTLLLGFADR
jgi:hypothetical protein